MFITCEYLNFVAVVAQVICRNLDSCKTPHGNVIILELSSNFIGFIYFQISIIRVYLNFLVLHLVNLQDELKYSMFYVTQNILTLLGLITVLFMVIYICCIKIMSGLCSQVFVSLITALYKQYKSRITMISHCLHSILFDHYFSVNSISSGQFIFGIIVIILQQQELKNLTFRIPEVCIIVSFLTLLVLFGLIYICVLALSMPRFEALMGLFVVSISDMYIVDDAQMKCIGVVVNFILIISLQIFLQILIIILLIIKFY